MKEGFPLIGKSTNTIIEKGAMGIAEVVKYIPPVIAGVLAAFIIWRGFRGSKAKA